MKRNEREFIDGDRQQQKVVKGNNGSSGGNNTGSNNGGGSGLQQFFARNPEFNNNQPSHRENRDNNRRRDNYNRQSQQQGPPSGYNSYNRDNNRENNYRDNRSNDNRDNRDNNRGRDNNYPPQQQQGPPQQYNKENMNSNYNNGNNNNGNNFNRPNSSGGGNDGFRDNKSGGGDYNNRNNNNGGGRGYSRGGRDGSSRGGGRGGSFNRSGGRGGGGRGGGRGGSRGGGSSRGGRGGRGGRGRGFSNGHGGGDGKVTTVWVPKLKMNPNREQFLREQQEKFESTLNLKEGLVDLKPIKDLPIQPTTQNRIPYLLVVDPNLPVVELGANNLLDEEMKKITFEKIVENINKETLNATFKKLNIRCLLGDVAFHRMGSQVNLLQNTMDVSAAMLQLVSKKEIGRTFSNGVGQKYFNLMKELLTNDLHLKHDNLPTTVTLLFNSPNKAKDFLKVKCKLNENNHSLIPKKTVSTPVKLFSLDTISAKLKENHDDGRHSSRLGIVLEKDIPNNEFNEACYKSVESMQVVFNESGGLPELRNVTFTGTQQMVEFKVKIGTIFIYNNLYVKLIEQYNIGKQNSDKVYSISFHLDEFKSNKTNIDYFKNVDNLKQKVGTMLRLMGELKEMVERKYDKMSPTLTQTTAQPPVTNNQQQQPQQ